MRTPECLEKKQNPNRKMKEDEMRNKQRERRKNVVPGRALDCTGKADGNLRSWVQMVYISFKTLMLNFSESTHGRSKLRDIWCTCARPLRSTPSLRQGKKEKTRKFKILER